MSIRRHLTADVAKVILALLLILTILALAIRYGVRPSAPPCQANPGFEMKGTQFDCAALSATSAVK